MSGTVLSIKTDKFIRSPSFLSHGYPPLLTSHWLPILILLLFSLLKAEFTMKHEPAEVPNGGIESYAKIKQLEKNLVFVKEKHAEVLKFLHHEVDQLKRKNRELQNQLIVKIESPKESSRNITSPYDEEKIKNLERELQRVKTALKESFKANTYLSNQVEYLKRERMLAYSRVPYSLPNGPRPQSGGSFLPPIPNACRVQQQHGQPPEPEPSSHWNLYHSDVKLPRLASPSPQYEEWRPTSTRTRLPTINPQSSRCPPRQEPKPHGKAAHSKAQKHPKSPPFK